MSKVVHRGRSARSTALGLISAERHQTLLSTPVSVSLDCDSAHRFRRVEIVGCRLFLRASMGQAVDVEFDRWVAE
jgi:hypothetical protein